MNEIDDRIRSEIARRLAVERLQQWRDAEMERLLRQFAPRHYRAGLGGWWHRFICDETCQEYRLARSVVGNEVARLYPSDASTNTP